MTGTINVSCIQHGIFRLDMNEPTGKNRVTVESSREFLTALANVAREPELKVLLMTGREDVFCSGASLDLLRELTSGNLEERDLFAVQTQLLAFPVPIVAALQGHAIGGGLMLALCCDVLVASESSRYGANFTRVGFTPGMGATALLPAGVGYHRASEMILTGKLYKGRELKGTGLFNYVVPSAQVFDTALNVARDIAEKPKHVLQMLKEALALPRLQALHEAKHREHLMHKVCFSLPETQSIIEAAYLKQV
jgi:polyketide biosynthesis enoyl-CoA hydratase PksI